MEILESLARNSPQTVKDLAVDLGLSYMGIKSQCLLLEESGYLETRRKRRRQGRPEILYSLADRSHDLFPDHGFPLVFSLLDQVSRLYGKQSLLKLVFLHFQSKAEAYLSAIDGTTPESRAMELATLRSAEGYYSRFEPGPPAVLVDGHDPLRPLFKKFPEAAAFETEALSRVVGVRMERTGPSRFTLGNM
jgi:predicted ArsR family transcriptional regulator